jgi:alkylation response protein AidB-like acyl-CoA dehydrogenase
MDFSISDDQRSLQELAREILGDAVTHAHLKQLEAQGWSVFDRDLWRKLAEAGLTGIGVPEEHGGAGLGFLDLALVLEEVGRAVAPVPAVATLVLGALPLARFGSAGLRARILPGVATGDVVLTAALAEPGEPSPLAPTTTAVADGDGWVLRGEKAFVPYAEQADWVLVPAAADDGVGVFLVPRGAQGATVTPLQTTNREPQGMLELDGVRVPAADVLAGPADGAEVVRFVVHHGTAALCAVAAGVAQAALKTTAAYTSSREQFGKPIASFQAVGQRAADAYIDTEVVRLTAYQAAWRLAEGLPSADEVAVAKFWAGDGGSRVVHACQHLHGGIGVDLDYPLHRYFLWMKQIEHELGTPTRQLLTLGASLAATPV